MYERTAETHEMPIFYNSPMVASMPPPPQVPTMSLAPETPCRMRPISFEDRETPPPLPYQMQAVSDGFHQFQVGQLGVVSEECEKVKLTYEDALSPRSNRDSTLLPIPKDPVSPRSNRDSNLLAIPKEDMPPFSTPQRQKAPCSPPSSVVQTPCPGPWVMDTPSPQNCASLANYAFGVSLDDAFGPFPFPGTG